ncbi:MAG: hypothetical protein NTV34_11460 [Proteobacteria bacterium]|nr:hypothetical protein [Pseudomonadota bacterium]
MSKPGSTVSTRSKYLDVNLLPSPEDLWMNIGLLIQQAASWNQSVCDKGPNIEKVNPAVGSFICDINANILKFRQGTDGLQRSAAIAQSTSIMTCELLVKWFEFCKERGTMRVCKGDKWQEQLSQIRSLI